MYLKNVTTKSTRSYLEDIKILKEKIENADAIVVGAGEDLVHLLDLFIMEKHSRNTCLIL